MRQVKINEYNIIASTLFSNDIGFSLGVSKDQPVRYVTWQFSKGKTSDSHYMLHCFIGEDAKDTAMKDYEERIADHQRRYPVEIKERMADGVTCELEAPVVASDTPVFRATVTLELMLRDGETEEQAQNRLYDLLYDGLCRTADHHCDFTIEESALKE